jgi:co-chaperonin GroES (HSP10)
MERVNTLQLGEMGIDVNWCLASSLVKPLRGRFYAVESPEQEQHHGLYLSDGAKQSLKSDVCKVIAVGADCGLSPGDTILVRPDHGTWVEGFKVGPYHAEARVRIYGMAWTEDNDPIPLPWDLSAPIKLKDGQMNATGTNIIIKRDAVIQERGGIYLPDSQTHRTCIGTVVSVGPSVTDIKAGERIHYDPTGLLDFLFGNDPDLAILRWEAVNAIIIEEAA